MAFETAIIERYRRRESSVEEALIEMYLASVPVRQVIERVNHEIKRRTRAIGAFLDGQSALMLVCARLRHVAGTKWGCSRYMNMKHLYDYPVSDSQNGVA